MEKLIYPRFLIVKDNFYSDPELVYQTALRSIFYEPKGYTGLRSKTVYHEKGVKTKLEKILGIRISRWDTDPDEENGVFYQAMSIGKNKEVPGVHADYPYNDITVVIYLTPGIPFHCGTSLWMHKRTGLIDAPTPAAAGRLKMRFSKLVDLFEDDAKKRSKWIEIDRAGYRPNRMVAYPSGAMHSATNHYGGDLVHSRIYQTFRIGVNWKTFRMNKAT